MSGEFYYPEIMPPGVALFDYDNDGDLDVFVVQGQMLGSKPIASAKPQPRGPLPLTGRLFRNDLQVAADGTRTLHFTDVTAASGIVTHGYSMGVATGDFNNDGCIDLYVTSLGRNQLFRNNCDGTFTDVSKASRTDDDGWSISAAFVDYDRDGWLDLFVGNYLNYSLEANIHCFSLSGSLDYCPPHVYRAHPSHLYHNNRDGTFTDVTVAAGMSREFGPALGVSTADFNGDGWIDIYVANDGQPNQLWINQHNGTFKNTALLSGAALSPEGEAKSSMGVDAGDFDNDGDEDLFITELTGQGDDLYVNDGHGRVRRPERPGRHPSAEPAVHRVRRRLVRLRQRRMARSADGQRRRHAERRSAGAERAVLAAAAQAAVQKSRQRAVRGRHETGRCRVRDSRSEPRRGVRRHRQRRRHRRRRRQRQRSRCGCS